MKKILIVCEQEADFLGPHAVLFRVTADDVGKSVEAPAWVQDTLLFKSLKNDGLIRVSREKILEEPSEPVKEPVKVTRKRTTKKKDDAE